MNRRNEHGSVWLTALATAILLAGCQGRETVKPPITQRETADSRSWEQPLIEMSRVAGAQVTYKETPDGASLVFTTNEDVARLRSGARRVVELHDSTEDNAGVTGICEDPPRRCCLQWGSCADRIPWELRHSSRVRVEDIPGGAEIHFELDKAPLRRFVAEHADQLRANGHNP